jgi:hypothetical protein
MDTGLQVYGGPFFRKLKEEGTKAFQLIAMPDREPHYFSYFKDPTPPAARK